MIRDRNSNRINRLALGLLLMAGPGSLWAGIVEQLSTDENMRVFQENIQNAQPENWKQLIKTHGMPRPRLSVQALNGTPDIQKKVKLLRTSEKNLADSRRALDLARVIFQMASEAKVSEKLTQRLNGLQQKATGFEAQATEAESAYLALVGALNQRLILRWRERFAELAATKAQAELNNQTRWKEDQATWEQAEKTHHDLKAFQQTFSASVVQAGENATQQFAALISANAKLSGSMANLNRELKKIRSLSFVENALIDLQTAMREKCEKSQPDAEQAIDRYYDVRLAMAAGPQAQARYEAARDALKSKLGIALRDPLDRILNPAEKSE